MSGVSNKVNSGRKYFLVFTRLRVNRNSEARRMYEGDGWRNGEIEENMSWHDKTKQKRTINRLNILVKSSGSRGATWNRKEARARGRVNSTKVNRRSGSNSNSPVTPYINSYVNEDWPRFETLLVCNRWESVFLQCFLGPIFVDSETLNGEPFFYSLGHRFVPGLYKWTNEKL